MSLFSPDFVAAKEEYLQALKQSKAPTGPADPSDFANLAHLARKKLETMGLTRTDVDALSDSGAQDSLLMIHAPRSGVIMAKNAVLGNLVNVGDTLFTIGDLSRVWFTGDLYPEDLPKIKRGQQVVISVSGLDKPVFGKVSFISPLVDPTTRSIKIRALMDNPDGFLRQDMYVQGSITISERRALVVPEASVVRSPEGDIVYARVEKESRETPASLQFRKTPVVVQAIQGGMAAIAKGLQEGDQVVSQGALLLDGVLNQAENAK
jgi:Cu(I)/Ag(I) efflux system membrane fusion protein